MNEVTPQEAQDRLHHGALLIDVREPHEYDEVHATGAVLMPLSSFQDQYATLSQDAEIIVICRSGARSAQATSFLTDSGYRNVSNLKGGTLAWVQDNLPTGDGQ